MGVSGLITAFGNGKPVLQVSEAMRASACYSQETLKITTENNGGYNTPYEIRSLMSNLTGQELD